MLQHALCIVEIDHRIIRIPCDGIAPPCEESCHFALFLDEFRNGQCLREEDGRNVKEPQIEIPTCHVARRILENARQEGRADERILLHERVHDGNRAAEDAVLGHAELVESRCARKAERELLRHAEGGKGLAHGIDKRLHLTDRPLQDCPRRHFRCDVVKTVEPRNLLRDVLHQRHVSAP